MSLQTYLLSFIHPRDNFGECPSCGFIDQCNKSRGERFYCYDCKIHFGDKKR